MTCSVRVADEAKYDLEDIFNFLVRRKASPAAAKSLMAAIDSIEANLASFPQMYPEVSDPRLSRMGYRKAIAGNYVVLYQQIDDDNIVVARVFHCRQDYARSI